jgi:hypothetical protein
LVGIAVDAEKGSQFSVKWLHQAHVGSGMPEGQSVSSGEMCGRAS